MHIAAVILNSKTYYFVCFISGYFSTVVGLLVVPSFLLLLLYHEKQSVYSTFSFFYHKQA